jgi:hypothetical protein
MSLFKRLALTAPAFVLPFVRSDRFVAATLYPISTRTIYESVFDAIAQTYAAASRTGYYNA